MTERLAPFPTDQDRRLARAERRDDADIDPETGGVPTPPGVVEPRVAPPIAPPVPPPDSTPDESAGRDAATPGRSGTHVDLTG